jgi:xylulokinase
LTLTGQKVEEFKLNPALPIYLPYINSAQGTTVRDSGLWVGVTPACTKADLVCSVMEGTCFWFRQSIELHTTGFGVEVRCIRLIGGLAGYRGLTQMKTEVINYPIEVPDYSDLSLLGAAIIAGIGVGEYRSWDDPYESIHLPMSTFIPNPDNANFYKKRLLFQNSVISIDNCNTNNGIQSTQ